MITLVAGDVVLDLPKDMALALELRFNIFNLGDPLGSFVPNITIPATPKNQAALGFPHRLAKRDLKALEIDGYFNLGANDQMPALIKVRKATTQGIELMIGVGNGIFFNKFKNKNLREFEYGGKLNLFGVEAGFTDFNPFTPEVSPFALFPVFNPGFVTEEVALATPLVNNIRWQNMFTYTDTDDPMGGAAWVMTPFYYLHWMVNKLMEDCGYKVNFNCLWQDLEMRNWCIFNVTDCTYLNTDISTLTRWSYPNLHMPNMTVGKFLIAIQRRYNIRFVFSLLKKELSIYKFDEMYLSNSYEEIKAYTEPEINYEDVPTGYVLTEEAPQNDGHYSEADIDKFLDDKDYSYTIVDNYSDLPAATLANKGDVYYVTNLGIYFQCRNVIDNFHSWQVAYFFKAEYKIGDGADDIDTECTTLPMGRPFWKNHSFYPLSDYVYCPVANIVGGFTNPGILGKLTPTADFSLRILSFRGENTSGRGTNMRFGSSDICKTLETGALVPGAKYSHNWKNTHIVGGNVVESGIYDMFYKNFFDLKFKATSVRFQSPMELEKLLHLSYAKPWRIGQTIVIPNNVSANITHKGARDIEINGFVI